MITVSLNLGREGATAVAEKMTGQNSRVLPLDPFCPIAGSAIIELDNRIHRRRPGGAVRDKTVDGITGL